MEYVASSAIRIHLSLARVVLNERYEKKDKITIADQEKRLKEELVKIGVDAQKDLTVFGLSSFASRRRKDDLGSKEYRLKLSDVSKAGMVQISRQPATQNVLPLYRNCRTMTTEDGGFPSER